MKSVGQIIDDLLVAAVKGGHDRFYWESEDKGYELNISLKKIEEEEE